MLWQARSGPQSSYWPFFCIFQYTHVLASAQIISIEKEKIDPDIYPAYMKPFMFGNFPRCHVGGQSTQRSQPGSQILTPVMKQGPLFP